MSPAFPLCEFICQDVLSVHVLDKLLEFKALSGGKPEAFRTLNSVLEVLQFFQTIMIIFAPSSHYSLTVV